MSTPRCRLVCGACGYATPATGCHPSVAADRLSECDSAACAGEVLSLDTDRLDDALAARDEVDEPAEQPGVAP